MQTVDIEKAVARLDELVDQAAAGEPFIIAGAGTPLAKVVKLDAPRAPQRIGFMEGEFEIPDDFDDMYREEIEAMFYGEA